MTDFDHLLRHGPIIAEVHGTPSAGTLALRDEAATHALAHTLATAPGIVQAHLALDGDLGCGKTTFARALLRALGAQGRIKSPTYAVLEPYPQLPSFHGPLDAWHFDLYRFQRPQEWVEAGFDEVLAGPGLKLIEWSQQAGKHLPVADLQLRLAWPQGADLYPEGHTHRMAHLQAHTPLGRDLLGHVLAGPAQAGNQP